MSETEQERTEEATPRKRQEARDEGQIPRSQELSTAALLLGSALTLNATGPALARALMDTFGGGLLVAGAGPLDGTAATALVRGLGWKTLGALGATLGAMAAIGAAVGAAQARGVLSSKALSPKWDRVNPGKNLKQMLGVKPWADLVKALAKVGIVGWAVHSSLERAWPDILALAQQSPFGILAVVRQYSLRLLLTAGLAYLVLAAADYVFQLWQHEKSLRMTKEEVKLEHKQSEGDPMLKARMRSIGRQRARRQMFTDVPKADVVIANPTHIAIALKYDPAVAPAPYVLAMGQRKVAERIKKIAFDSGVPVIENKPLARALLASARVGTTIPVDLYLAVAEVLAFVIRQREQMGSAWKGTATA